MTVDNGVAHNGVTLSIPNFTVSLKNSGEIECLQRRRKQKKNKKGGSEIDVEEGDVSAASDSKENADPQQPVSEEVVVEYVSEQPGFEDGFDDEFRKIFDKFNFRKSVASEEDDKKGESEEKADVKKKLDLDSDSDEADQDNQNKEKGISNKKKKLQRRMKIAELKQVSARPDVVEVWNATSADPKLLVFLKSYRNTVHVPRHWSQKRKYLQGNM